MVPSSAIARTAAVLAPWIASVRQVAASCVTARAGDASVSTGCAPAAGSPFADDDDFPGPFVAIASGHPPPAPVYVPVYVPVHVPVAAPATATDPAAANDRDRDRDRDPADPPAGGNRGDRGDDAGDADDAGAADVTIELDCAADPETTRVTNNGADPVTVNRIETLGGAGAGVPLERDDTIRPGRTIEYQSGDAADGRFNLGSERYVDDDREAGVRLDTSGGEFEALCFTS